MWSKSAMIFVKSILVISQKSEKYGFSDRTQGGQI